MKTLLRILFLAAMMLPLASCGGGEAESSNDALDTITEAANEASEASAETTDAAADLGTGAAEVICCNGSCDAPAGFCHADGTCNGSHAELPIAP